MMIKAAAKAPMKPDLKSMKAIQLREKHFSWMLLS